MTKNQAEMRPKKGIIVKSADLIFGPEDWPKMCLKSKILMILRLELLDLKIVMLGLEILVKLIVIEEIADILSSRAVL